MVLAWVVLLVLVDFCYFLYHWASHRVNFLWATHEVHWPWKKPRSSPTQLLPSVDSLQSGASGKP